MTRWRALALAVAMFCAPTLAVQSASAQTTRIPPRAGYQFHDEQTVGPFVAQRWVSAASPEVSPAGTCECLVVVYLGSRRVLTVGAPGEVSAIAVGPPTGRDIDGDGVADVVVSRWSGGAHCCYTTTAYSVGAEVRTLLSIETGDCGPGEFADLDGDGVLEFTTCDDIWKDTYCSFALAPLPTVVFAYNARQRQYRPSTPRFAGRLRREIDGDLVEAKKYLAENGGKDAGDDKCAALRPALDLMYAGQLNEGAALLRSLYRRGDVDAFVKEAISKTRASPLWVSR
jgi:hypothetical protein